MNSKPAFDASRAVWRKSSRSNGSGGNCVEVCDTQPGAIGVRDSKHPDSGHLVFTPTEWRAFVEGVRVGEFDI
jgi:hypothetical protein